MPLPSMPRCIVCWCPRSMSSRTLALTIQGQVSTPQSRRARMSLHGFECVSTALVRLSGNHLVRKHLISKGQAEHSGDDLRLLRRYCSFRAEMQG